MVLGERVHDRQLVVVIGAAQALVQIVVDRQVIATIEALDEGPARQVPLARKIEHAQIGIVGGSLRIHASAPGFAEIETGAAIDMAPECVLLDRPIDLLPVADRHAAAYINYAVRE